MASGWGAPRAPTVDRFCIAFAPGKIVQSVAALSDAELKRFAAWFADHQWDRWDRQLESDIKAGKLDRLADQALADHAVGRTRPL